MKRRIPMAPLRRKSKTRPAAGAISRRPLDYLFVYGTLMRGEKSHHELVRNQNAKFLGPARIRGELYELAGQDFPGAVPSALPNRFVRGQLFRLSDPERVLKNLDEFEGTDEGLFHRRSVDVWFDGRKLRAWAYFYSQPLKQADQVSNGTYRSA
jgi:gamma-glutamylcyclotransferase (GGCT)/AIG2-like uncharacterized protein YtfP